MNRQHKGKPKRADLTTTMVLKAVRDSHRADTYDVVPRLMSTTGCAEKVAYAALHRDVDNGYLDYGVNARGSWLTPKGKAYLADQETRNGN